MSRLLTLSISLALALSLVAQPSSARAASCTATPFIRDGLVLTAAQVGGTVTGELNATGCNIGAYFDASHRGSVTDAEIFGANYFGVVVNGTDADVTDSYIHDIGETPFNGSQHGIGIYYYGSTGTISGNRVSQYQKGGIVANMPESNVVVAGNTVTGLGPVDFIAQNGIQLGWDAVGDVYGNDVSENFYTGTVGVGPNPGGQNPPGWEYFSAGILLYNPGPGTKTHENRFEDNQHNYARVP